MQRWIYLGLLLLLLAGCGSQSSAPTEVAAAQPSATKQPTTPTTAATATAAASATPAPPTATATPEPTATPAGLSDADLAALSPNEMGWVMVLEYHLIEEPNADYSRAPASFQQDLEWLYANNFYPITFRDLAAGHIDVPAGKSPVVLTFDDSSDGQFRYLSDGSVDPTSAMGMLLAFADAHPDFPAVATFFPLIEVDVPERVLFGQPELATQKLQKIVELGGEVGSHTYTHQRMDQADAEHIQWQLAFSNKELEERIGAGYKVTSLSLPLGIYPEDESLIHAGSSEGVDYAYAAAAEVAGGASPSPFSRNFDPYHIRRTQAVDSELEYWFGLFEERPDLKFVSDGDPDTLTVPSEETLPEEQRDLIGDSAPDGMTLRRYERVDQ